MTVFNSSHTQSEYGFLWMGSSFCLYPHVDLDFLFVWTLILNFDFNIWLCIMSVGLWDLFSRASGSVFDFGFLDCGDLFISP